MSAGKVLAAGVVVYTKNQQNNILYLLLKSSRAPFHWTPPKGHVDEGESSLLATALRETEEEAGLTASDLELRKFETTITYVVKGKEKFVTYFLAQLKNDKEITLSYEHTQYEWADCAKACELIGYPTTGKVITECQTFLETEN